MKNGFTLAEVLITLGIIGVVTALTLPIFISNVQRQIQAKRVENINQKLSKVMDKMAVQSGLIGYPDTMAYVLEMKKHMNIAKVCDNSHLSECWGTTEVVVGKDKTWKIAKTKTAKNFKINSDNWADTVGIVTADGTPIILSYDKECNFDVNNTGLRFDKSSGKSNSLACISGVFDWNGGAKPNKLGDDVLMLGMASGLGNSCAVEIGDLCFSPPFLPTPLTFAECEAEKDNLGIRECCPTNICPQGDGLGGAVKACKNQGMKLATPTQLAEFASQMYVGKPSIKVTGPTTHIQYDYNSPIVKAYGSLYPFILWSNEEINQEFSSLRLFLPNATVNTTMYSRANSFYAICVDD